MVNLIVRDICSSGAGAGLRRSAGRRSATTTTTGSHHPATTTAGDAAEGSIHGTTGRRDADAGSYHHCYSTT